MSHRLQEVFQTLKIDGDTVFVVRHYGSGGLALPERQTYTQDALEAALQRQRKMPRCNASHQCFYRQERWLLSVVDSLEGAFNSQLLVSGGAVQRIWPDATWIQVASLS
jgi:hypothetical protein